MSMTASLDQIAPSFTGQLLQPTDAGYDEARRVHNGLVDKRPALIARCHGAADIVDAVKLARTLNLDVAVRGGGHNVAGKAAVDGGLMIDLAPMKGIHVDPRRAPRARRAACCGRSSTARPRYTDSPPPAASSSTTGIAGLTLGGGLGWLMPKYGLALDNLRSAELVMADGRVLRASADEHPDLFWAIRGGGGNFGIAASLEYALHPVGPIITAAWSLHPLATRGDVLRFFRDACATLPDEVMLAAGLQTAPDGSGAKLIGLVGCHCGSLAARREGACSRSRRSGRRSSTRWDRCRTARSTACSTAHSRRAR